MPGRSRVVRAGCVAASDDTRLRVFLTILKDIRRKSGDLRLAAARPTVHRMLTMSGFTSILKLFDSVDDAMRSFA